MSRSDIREILGRAEVLAAEIKEFVPDNSRTITFRADLAGLLVVSMAASYEASVKETLMGYAARHHTQFGHFAQNHFAKLNSRIKLNELYGYARTFDNRVHRKFGEVINAEKAGIFRRTGKDIASSYEQVLGWRHDFAHAGLRNTTINEALQTHRLAKRVLYAFHEAFS